MTDRQGCSHRIFSNTIARLARVFLPLVLMVGLAAPLSGGCAGREDREAEETFARPARGDFRLEAWGGFAALAPRDLNLFHDYTLGRDRFLFDRQLDFLQNNGILAAWSRTSDGDSDPLTWAASLGLRARYQLSGTLSVTLGAICLNGSEAGDLQMEFNRSGVEGTMDRETQAYTPLSLSVRGVAPMLGLLFEMPVYESVFAGLYLAGGPLFAGCRTLSDWKYSWSHRTGEGFDLIYSYEGRLEQEGRGTGAALEIGLRVGSPLTSRLDFFCEGGYALLIVPELSGPGEEILADGPRSWDGPWGIRELELTAPWGDLLLEIPTSDLPDGLDGNGVRDFKLDLSGFKLRMGLSFRF